MRYEEKTDGDGGVMGEVQGLESSEEEDARANDAVGADNNGPRRSAQDCHGLQVPQLPPQNVIRWDRFLPLRSLKVLLVENDDSTRQVVSALLRNCSYEVTDVANGIQAWKILEDLNNHFDLVLTEVVMPTLSGIGFLCKIMSHKTLKNIPVIMMSSNDSMSVVFKCLSKGAADFLVKPIRKNELKNLWQHVWRRCYCSSGSGSESGTQTKKSLKSKSIEESENNSDSSDELDDYGSNPIRDGSDNGSGTQSSWTKRVSPTCQFADAPDSTCAQVIHTKPENWATDDIAMAKELSSHATSKKQNRLSEADSKQVETGQLEQNNENTINKPKDQAADTAIADINCINHLTERKINASSGPSDIYQLKGKACCDFGELPSLELSLNGLRQAGDGGSTAKGDRHVLRHSDLSAFSKYNTASSANQGPTGNGGSCCPLDNSSVAMKTEAMQNVLFHLSGTLFNQLSNGSTNSNDVASTAKNICPKPETLNEKSESTSAFKSFYSSASQAVQNGHVCLLQQVTSGKVEGAGVKTVKSSHQHVQVQHHHHYHHQYHHHIHSMQQRQSQAEQDDISLNKMAGAAPQCGSSNVVGGPTEVNDVNYSVNGSASGSNHGSNGQNGRSVLLNTGLTNIDSENRNGENSEPGHFSERISGNAIGEDRVAQREAALSKFRQKRKERCFEKKVRYQSRKRLAEQRPRVKGQFVRQIVFDAKAGNVSESNDLTSEDNSCDSVR